MSRDEPREIDHSKKEIKANKEREKDMQIEPPGKQKKRVVLRKEYNSTLLSCAVIFNSYNNADIVY